MATSKKNIRANSHTTRFTKSPRTGNESKLNRRLLYPSQVSSPFRVIAGKIVECDYKGNIRK